MSAVLHLSELATPGASPLQRAVIEIAAAPPPVRSLRRERAARQVMEVDQLLDQLEELHLRGYVRVPDRVVARVEAFLLTLPPECRREFPVRTRISRVLDELFELQDSLLSIKVAGRVRIMAEEAAGSL